MTFVIEAQPIPLHVNEDGLVMITGSRVPVDTVVRAYRNGDTAEEIAGHYEAIKLSQVYAVIAYYLEHQHEVDDYLKQRQMQQEETRRFIDETFDQESFRRRLLILRRQHA